MQSSSLIRTLFCAVLLLATLDQCLTTVSAETEAEPIVLTFEDGSAKDATAVRDHWIEAYTTLANSLIRLPFDSSAPAAALSLVRAYRATVDGRVTRYTHRFGRLLIPLLEKRTFPNALELMKQRSWFRESSMAHDYDADTEEGDLPKPKLIRANLLHVLAARGFKDAASEFLSFMTHSEQAEALGTGCAIQATLGLDEATPLHLLALYASDDINTSAVEAVAAAASASSTNDKPESATVAIAKMFIERGANLTAACAPDDLTPLTLAAERGYMSLVTYFLSHLPQYYNTPSDEIPLTPEERATKEEWQGHLRANTQRHEEEVRAGTVVHNATAWSEYLDWFDQQMPRSPFEVAVQAWQKQIQQALQVAVMSDRLEIVRYLLRDEYRMRPLLNVRAYEGRGDCLIHATVIHGLIDMTRLLLQAGADPFILSHDGLQLPALAQQYQKTEMSEFLKNELPKYRGKKYGTKRGDIGLPPTTTDVERDSNESQSTRLSEDSSIVEESSDAPASSANESGAAADTDASGSSTKSKYQQAKENAKQKRAKKQKKSKTSSTTRASTKAAAPAHDEL